MNSHKGYPRGGAPKKVRGQSFIKRVVIAFAPLLLTASAALPALSSAYSLIPGSTLPVLSCHGDTPGFCPDSPFAE
jgi:hypothetical protein